MEKKNNSSLRKPVVAHVIYRLGVGGLENGLVNLINHMPGDRVRHVIICITDYTSFAKRIQGDRDVDIIAMHKKPGKDFGFYFRLWRVFLKLKPDIVHTRNLGALDAVVPALFAGVKLRVQGEHGRDMSDISGTRSKYLMLRKLLNPFVSRYIALSQDLQSWLTDVVGVSPRKISQIYNGVDCSRFNRTQPVPELLAQSQGEFVIGTVGRLQAEKNQALLLHAFARLLQLIPDQRQRVRLVLVGDGPDRQKLEQLLTQLDIHDRVILAGTTDNVAGYLAGFDLFALSSLIEGVSNTILEAMCMELAVVATDVGGNPELVVSGQTGTLVASDDSDAFAQAMLAYYNDQNLCKTHGQNAKHRVLTQFSMTAMVNNYLKIYEGNAS